MLLKLSIVQRRVALLLQAWSKCWLSELFLACHTHAIMGEQEVLSGCPRSNLTSGGERDKPFGSLKSFTMYCASDMQRTIVIAADLSARDSCA